MLIGILIMLAWITVSICAIGIGILLDKDAIIAIGLVMLLMTCVVDGF